MTKWYFRTDSGYLVIATEFATIEEARESARRWNADPDTREERKVAVIANAERTAEATRVTAVY